MFRIFRQGEALGLNELPRGACLANFSMLHDVSEPVVFRGFSVKYVLEGCEQYTVNGSRYDVHGGEYLLANASCTGRVNVDSPELVKGLCIDISPGLLSAAFASRLQPGSAEPDAGTGDFFNTEAFLENKYGGVNTQAGRLLEAVGRRLATDPGSGHSLDDSFYAALATAIVEDHRPVISRLYRIGTVKHSTRKELYRKLCRGKTFLDGNWDASFHIDAAAAHATISPYHFFRLFRVAFGQSPQQYLIRLRLERAKALLGTGNYSVTDVALTVGFGDLAGFSKAFKKSHGMSPLRWVQSRGSLQAGPAG